MIIYIHFVLKYFIILLIKYVYKEYKMLHLSQINTFYISRCELICPEGIKFSAPPAPVYTCNYSTGQFSPGPVPTCLFGKIPITKSPPPKN